MKLDLGLDISAYQTLLSVNYTIYMLSYLYNFAFDHACSDDNNASVNFLSVVLCSLLPRAVLESCSGILIVCCIIIDEVLMNQKESSPIFLCILVNL